MATGDIKILKEVSGPAYTETTLDAVRGFIAGINAQTGTTYTLALSDLGKLVTCNNASSITVTVPPESSVAFDDNSVVIVQRLGDGQVTIEAGSGVTVTGKRYITAYYNIIVLIKVGEDAWTAIGGADA